MHSILKKTKILWIFSPLLLLYIGIIINRAPQNLVGDESRYLEFAANLTSGFYSPPPPDINLWSGPGYPIFLIPFILTGSSLITIRLANAILLYLAVIILHHSLHLIVSQRKSIIISYIMGIYWLPYKTLPNILTETFTIFLISLIVYQTHNIYNKKPNSLNIILFSTTIGYLALTKVIFGYVIMIFGITSLIIGIICKNNTYRITSLILFGALLITFPYLLYTYSLTGRIFYWSNAGGMSLYWMSNPVDGEWGEWHNSTFTTVRGIDGASEKLRQNHQDDYDAILPLKGVAQDDAFKEYALKNIKSHPTKYLKNWLANLGRMFFNYPSSYYPQQLSTYANIIPNMFVLVLTVILSPISFRYRKKLPPGLFFLFIFFAIYLGLSSLVSAYERMFYILIPAVVFYTTVVIDRTIKVEWKPMNNLNL